MRRHARLLCDWQGSEHALKSFRKHANWYLTGFPVGGAVRDRLHRVDSIDGLEEILAALDPETTLPVESMRTPRSHKGGPRPVALPPGWLDDPDCSLALGEEADAFASGG
jgi:hypothetical protein